MASSCSCGSNGRGRSPYASLSLAAARGTCTAIWMKPVPRPWLASSETRERPRPSSDWRAIDDECEQSGADAAEQGDEPDEVRADNRNRGPRRLSPVFCELSEERAERATPAARRQE